MSLDNRSRAGIGVFMLIVLVGLVLVPKCCGDRCGGDGTTD